MTCRRLSLLLAILILPACRGDEPPPADPSSPPSPRSGPRTPPPTAPAAAGQPAPPARDGIVWKEQVPLPRPPAGKLWAFDGASRSALTAEEGRAAGLTRLDLGDDWTPILFTEHRPGDAAPQPHPYRQRFLDLANERTDADGHPLRRGQHGDLELYGIPPSLSVLRRRMADAERRTCLAGVDREALRALDQDVSPWTFRYAAGKAQALRAQAAKLIQRHRLKGDADLPTVKGGASLLRLLREAETRARVVSSAVQVLRCEGHLARRDGISGDEVYAALGRYEKRHMIVGKGTLTMATAALLARTADEADADAFRRALRERIVQAAQILEDGSAVDLASGYQDRQGRRHPLPNLVDAFRDAALAAMGLTTADAIRQFLLSVPAADLHALEVLVKLPPRPDYYSDNMDLEAIIDRGDVNYDPPVTADGKRVFHYRRRLPTLSLWVRTGEQRIPLVAWRTTVGGWNDELKDGKVYLRYKASSVGARIWRDVIAAPVWIPPPTTPPSEIIRGRAVDRRQMGPGPFSAYGLVAAPHLLPVTRGNVLRYHDEAIRTHGSVNYKSLQGSYSHGCHRLYNHLALRLFSFVLYHRQHERVGLEPYTYNHVFAHQGRSYRIKVDNRGYVYRLKDPIAITVTTGRIIGRNLRPPDGYVKKPGVSYDDPDGGVPAPAASSPDGGVPRLRPMPAPTDDDDELP
jgi:hypothetical protein